MKSTISIVELKKSHKRTAFDCGEPSLNDFLARFALQNQRNDNSRSFAAVNQDGDIFGYYSLTVGQVSHEDAPAEVSARQPAYPIPVAVLARLAVDQSKQGKGIGNLLMNDAMRRCLVISQQAGVRAVLVEAINDTAIEFYTRFGFQQSPINRSRLFLTLKSIRQALAPHDKT